MAHAAIDNLETRLFAVPLAEVLSDAKHGDHTHFELITVTVRLSDGQEGTGYSYTGGRGGRAIAAMIDSDLAPMLIGLDARDIDQNAGFVSAIAGRSMVRSYHAASAARPSRQPSSGWRPSA